MKFEVHAARSRGGRVEVARFFYDNAVSVLEDSSGRVIVDDTARQRLGDAEWGTAQITNPKNPLGKIAEVDTLKIQLGLACNYSCGYCSQRSVPRAEEGAPEKVEKFIRNLDSWLRGEPRKIEFWGGEPLVYWKSLRPLGEALRDKFKSSRFQMITNGSLLNAEINEWLDRLGFCVGLSHDGPGQKARGPDPLDDPEKRKWVLDLWSRLGPRGRMSFNAMTHMGNLDRGATEAFFEKFLGTKDFILGQGDFVDAYDEGGAAASPRTREEHLLFRRTAMRSIREGKSARTDIVGKRIDEWVNSISTHRPSSALGQKCGMDRLDSLAVDLSGYVITCQNVSAAAVAPNGRPHALGHVSNLEAVKLRTSTHWSLRPDCSSCPMLQACKGSCMFLEGDLFRQSCDNAYSDNLPTFAAAVEKLTGFLPFRIIGEDLPEERMDMWGPCE